MSCDTCSVRLAMHVIRLFYGDVPMYRLTRAGKLRTWYIFGGDVRLIFALVVCSLHLLYILVHPPQKVGIWQLLVLHRRKNTNKILQPYRDKRENRGKVGSKAQKKAVVPGTKHFFGVDFLYQVLSNLSFILVHYTSS